jgi:hypothetical protein
MQLKTAGWKEHYQQAGKSIISRLERVLSAGWKEYCQQAEKSINCRLRKGEMQTIDSSDFSEEPKVLP